MTADRAIELAESFAAAWDRHEWMQTHGEWASADYGDARAEYDTAVARLADMVDELPSAGGVDRRTSVADLREALDAIETAAKALDGQVSEDESDYIVEGVIDPDGVSGECNDANRVESASAQGWDCTEGHHTHLLADGRVAYNWYRSAFGQRHQRDLYVVVGTVEQDES